MLCLRLPRTTSEWVLREDDEAMPNRKFPIDLSTNAPEVIRRSFAAIALFWTAIIAGMLSWDIYHTNEHADEILLSQARPFFKQIIITRSWNARHGGVYVPITKDNPPNPYLKVPNRDIETTDGMKLTLVNPAYMTRQLSELANQEDNIVFHLTSDRPIRPANGPEPWELVAIKQMRSSQDEFFELWKAKDGKPYFRYMAPVWTEKACLKCHGAYGYKEGDLRGGLSITIPAATVIDREREAMLNHALAHLLLWLLGIFGLVAISREICKRAKNQEQLIQRLKHTLQGMLPICASCKSICNEEGEWEKLEQYITDHSEAELSHGICPSCADELFGNYLNGKGKGE